jgi:hypothetical protein
LRAVLATVAVMFLKIHDGFEFAQGFGFDGFGFRFVVEDGFEFLLLFPNGADGFGVVDTKIAFLESSVAFERNRFTGRWIL